MTTPMLYAEATSQSEEDAAFAAGAMKLKTSTGVVAL